MKIDTDDGLPEPELSMAPLIDVVFQLLIFFMVATSFREKERALDLDLPSTVSGAEEGRRDEEIEIDVFPDGRVLVAGREVARAELVGALVDAARGRDTTPVTVRGDRKATHEVVVAVLDACGQAGLSNLSIGTLDARARYAR